MKGWKRSALAILVLLVLFGFSAVNVANAVEAAIVSDVRGLRDYASGDNNFAHGSTLKVYTEMNYVNYHGFVFVDFVFIIEDPRGHVVSMDRMDVKRRDYDDDVYVVYTKKIPTWWLSYGKYKLDIYAYDRINKAKIVKLERKVETSKPEELIDNDDFEDLEEFFETACGGDEDDLEDLGVIKSFSDSRKEITHIRFFVRRKEEIKPAELPEEKKIEEPIFMVTDVGIDKFTVKPGETVSISVTVENRGIRGTKKVTLVINGEKEAEESVTLDYLASKTLHFALTKDMPGTYKVTIPGTDIVKLFFVEEAPSENSTLSASAVGLSGTEQQQSGEEKGLPNHIFGFGIAFIAIALFVFVITLLCFRLRSKQLSFNRFSR